MLHIPMVVIAFCLQVGLDCILQDTAPLGVLTFVSDDLIDVIFAVA
jgi:hypothetical protein